MTLPERVRTVLGLLLVVFGVSLRPAGGQEIIPDAPTCARCRIGVTEVVTLEDSPRAHMPGAPRAVTADGVGRYWLTYTNALPLVYNANGQLLRELGPRGDGPGEYRSPILVEPLPGDSVLVRDAGRRSLFVLSSDLVVRRSIAGGDGYGGQVVLDWPEMVAFKGPGRVNPGGSPLYVDLPTDVMDLSGIQVRKVATAGDGWGPGIAAAGEFGVWVWDYTPYRLVRWSTAGVQTGEVDRRPSWFPFTDQPVLPPVRGQRPPSLMQDVRQDASGRLWVFVNVPVAVWPEGDAVHPGRAMEQYFRTRVEVIDPAANRVIASTLLDVWIVSALPNERAAVYGTTPQGTPFVRIVQLAVLQ